MTEELQKSRAELRRPRAAGPGAGAVRGQHGLSPPAQRRVGSDPADGAGARGRLRPEPRRSAARRARVVKTARLRRRSHPVLHEAGRDRQYDAALTVGRWRPAHDVAESPAEGAQAAEPDIEADVGHAEVGLTQEEHRALHATALQVAVRRLAKGRSEGADKVCLGGVGYPGEGGDVERLGVGAVDGVTSAQHPAVGLLYGAAHGCTAASSSGWETMYSPVRSCGRAPEAAPPAP